MKALNVRKIAPLLGKQVVDSLSGYTGVVRGVRILNSGCMHVLVQREGLDYRNEPYSGIWLDLVGLHDYESLPKCERPDLLGVLVRDTLTDYEGIVVSISLLDGYDARVSIQGKTKTQEGVPSPEHACDLMYVERLDKKSVTRTRNTGAPAFLSRVL